jgi:hypothetical protein
MPGTRSSLTRRIDDVAAELGSLLAEADLARRERAEVANGGTGAATTDSEGTAAVCAWNHFENIPTFYNWNNRPR